MRVKKEAARITAQVLGIVFMILGAVAIMGEPNSDALLPLVFLKVGGVFSCWLGYKLFTWADGNPFIDRDTFRNLKG
jgi:hypothetical protein